MQTIVAYDRRVAKTFDQWPRDTCPHRSNEVEPIRGEPGTQHGHLDDETAPAPNVCDALDHFLVAEHVGTADVEALTTSLGHARDPREITDDVRAGRWAESASPPTLERSLRAAVRRARRSSQRRHSRDRSPPRRVGSSLEPLRTRARPQSRACSGGAGTGRAGRRRARRGTRAGRHLRARLRARPSRPPGDRLLRSSESPVSGRGSRPPPRPRATGERKSRP